MKTSDLYGFAERDLEKPRSAIEGALGIDLEERESSYLGGIYYRYGMQNSEYLMLRTNFDPVDQEWAEESFKSSAVLFYVEWTSRSDEIREALVSRVPGIKHLRRTEVDR